MSSISDEKHEQLINNVRTAISTANTETDVLQKAIELIDNLSDGFDWTGFYMMRGDMLEVGPYVGPETPHTKIELNSGICGAAASTQRSIIVDDVNADPRFLACSLTTKSEIVVPLMDGDICLGEIDIDSNQPAFFNDKVKDTLESVAEIVVARLKDID